MATTRRARKFVQRIGTHSRLVDEEIEALRVLRAWVEGKATDAQLRKAGRSYIKVVDAYAKVSP